MPVYPDSTAPRVLRFLADLAALGEQQWTGIVVAHEAGARDIAEARAVAGGLIVGDDAEVTEAQRKERLASAHVVARQLAELLEHLPETARVKGADRPLRAMAIAAARDALWGVLVLDDLAGPREHVRRKLMGPFAGAIVVEDAAA